VGGTICNIHTLEPFKELGLDSQGSEHLLSVNHGRGYVASLHILSGVVMSSLMTTTIWVSQGVAMACNPWTAIMQQGYNIHPNRPEYLNPN
jgi:hypothetical protein